jgi:hypothetical protein
MDVEELDLPIIEATDQYRPGHQDGTSDFEVDGVDTSPEDGADTFADDHVLLPRARGTEGSLLESRVAQLEADVESWQRRTAMWRERALSAQALNEALNTNLDDLRLALRAVAAGATHSPQPEVGGEVPAAPYEPRQLPSATVVEWCNRVFRRSFWTGQR